MTACASVVCSMIEGKTFDEALAVSAEDVKEALDGVPWDKAHTPVFAVEGVRAWSATGSSAKGRRWIG